MRVVGENELYYNFTASFVVDKYAKRFNFIREHVINIKTIFFLKQPTINGYKMYYWQSLSIMKVLSWFVKVAWPVKHEENYTLKIGMDRCDGICFSQNYPYN